MVAEGRAISFSSSSICHWVVKNTIAIKSTECFNPWANTTNSLHRNGCVFLICQVGVAKCSNDVNMWCYLKHVLSWQWKKFKCLLIFVVYQIGNEVLQCLICLYWEYQLIMYLCPGMKCTSKVSIHALESEGWMGPKRSPQLYVLGQVCEAMYICCAAVFSIEFW